MQHIAKSILLHPRLLLPSSHGHGHGRGERDDTSKEDEVAGADAFLRHSGLPADLIEAVERAAANPGGQESVKMSGKLEQLMKLVEGFYMRNEKTIIFSSSVHMLDLIAAAIHARSWGECIGRIKGG